MYNLEFSFTVILNILPYFCFEPSIHDVSFLINHLILLDQAPQPPSEEDCVKII